jgi:hypothetical protein
VASIQIISLGSSGVSRIGKDPKLGETHQFSPVPLSSHYLPYRHVIDPERSYTKGGLTAQPCVTFISIPNNEPVRVYKEPIIIAPLQQQIHNTCVAG